MFNTACNFWLSNNASVLHCLGKPKGLCCMTPVAVRWSLPLESSWVTRPSFSLLQPSSSLHVPPSVSPSPTPSLFVLFSLLLFSRSLSGRAARGGPSQPNPEPTGTRGSTGCNSESINSNKANVCLKRWQTVHLSSFLMLLRAWDLCSQEVCPCCSLRRWQRSLPPLRNRFRYHLYHWSTKFPFRCVSTVLPSGAKWLLSLLASHHLTRRQQLLDSPTFKSVFCDRVG